MSKASDAAAAVDKPENSQDAAACMARLLALPKPKPRRKAAAG